MDSHSKEIPSNAWSTLPCSSFFRISSWSRCKLRKTLLKLYCYVCYDFHLVWIAYSLNPVLDCSLHTTQLLVICLGEDFHQSCQLLLQKATRTLKNRQYAFQRKHNIHHFRLRWSLNCSKVTYHLLPQLVRVLQNSSNLLEAKLLKYFNRTVEQGNYTVFV